MTDRKTEAMHLSRRQMTALLASALVAPAAGARAADGAAPRAAFYAAVGADLTLYAVDEKALTLSKVTVTRAPKAVQYAWKHPDKPLLYVAFSNRYTVKDGSDHGVAVYNIEPSTGRLTPFGEPVRLANRPVNITLDPSGRYMLLAYNAPSALTVHHLGPDGAIGAMIEQREPVEAGIYAHQVRVSPSDTLVILPTRGNDATATAAEDPGAIKVFRFGEDGQLSHEASVREGDGHGFGPRHVDFHPSRPFMYVSMERNNQLLTYGVERDGITPAPLFTKSTLLEGGGRLPVQFVGPIHVHPNGRFVYLANRSDGTVDFEGRKVHGPGENSVAVFAIDGASGEPTLIQTADTQSFHCRTFSIHPGGRMLVTAAIEPLAVRDGAGVHQVPAALTVFSVGDDGRLALARKYDVEVGGDWQFWCGMVPLT